MSDTPLESKIKTKCKEQLEKWGWMVIHLMQTNCNGIPDTLAIHKIKGFVFIEFKRPGNDPRKLQEYRILKLKEYGVKVITVRSITDLNILK